MEKKLYLFFRDAEPGTAAKRAEAEGAEAVLRWLTEQALRQLSSEGYPVPAGIEPVGVLPGEWTGALEAPLNTPVSTLLGSIDWYFQQRGTPVKVSVYAYLGDTGKPKQFWMGAYALLPVWVETEAEKKSAPAAPAAETEAPAAEAPAPEAPAAAEKALESRRPEGARPWRDVYVFISSTFNDMHGERDYLIKRVFPALSEWCAARRLRLRDIDLRWGITEEDSMENRRTVEICLANIDRCRPFFLCFIGQRRGWVPGEQDIADGTFRDFPKLRERLGASVTEMEVIHALIDPMRRQELSDEDALTRAFFYLRDGAYLSDITSQALLNIYTNQNSDDPARDDRLLEEFRTRTIPGTGRPCRDYGCRWDPDGVTPELGAVRGAPEGITRGSLTDFDCGGRPLAETVLEDMKAAITDRFGLREDGDAETALTAELEQQSLFLHTAGESFIERAGDLDPFETYVRGAGRRPLILTAPAGMGKSSLLAHWILGAPYQVYYRFIGRSDRAGTAAGLAYSLWEQLHADGKVKDGPPEDAASLLDGFTDMLAEAAEEHTLILVIDAVDQLPGSVQDISFLPRQLPPGVKLILSVKEGSPGADRYLAEAAVFGEIVRVKPMSGLSDRSALADAYLSNYLKKLGDSQMDALIRSRGAANPLYLKIVLSELRVFGAYDTLQAHIEQDFGDTPVAAFDAMLRRIEGDAPVSGIPMQVLAQNVFGWLAHARYGLEVRELSRLLGQAGVCSDAETAADAVNVLVRQLRGFLTERDLRVDFFYDSFREACLRRYTADRPSVSWHGELARFFAERPVDDPHSLLERAYQLASSEQYDACCAYVMDYAYLAAQLSFGGIQGLLYDYSLVETDGTRTMSAFLGLAGAVLTADPDQLAPRLIGHLSLSPLPEVKKLLTQAESMRKGTWLKPLNPCFEAPESGVERTIAVRSRLSQSVALLRGDTLCAAIVDGSVIQIWELRTGAVVGTIPAPERAIFVQITGTGGGEKLAALTQPKNLNGDPMQPEVLVYETERFSRLARFPVAAAYIPYRYYRTHYLRACRFFIEGDLLILPDQPGSARVYRLTDGSVAGETKMYRWTGNCAALSEAGVAAVGNIHPQNPQDDFDVPGFERIENPVYLFRLDEETKELRPLGNPVGSWRSSVEAVALSPDGSLVAASDGMQTLVYRADTGALVRDLGLDSVRVLLFLKKRGLLLAAGHTVALYDAGTFELVHEYRGLGMCSAAAVSAGEDFALLHIDDKKLRVLSLAVRAGEGQSYSAPLPIRSIALLPDGRTVMASCYDNFVDRGKERTPGQSDDPRLFRFDGQTGACLGRMRLCGRRNRDFTFLSPDGAMAVSKNFQDADGYVFRCWNIPEGAADGDELYMDSFSQRKTRRGLSDFSGEMQFSADRRYMAIQAGFGQEVRVYRAKTGRLLGTVTLKPPGTWRQRLFNKDRYSDLGDAHFDVTDEGRTLVALFTDFEKSRLERYDVARNKCLGSVALPDGNPTHVVQTDYANQLMEVTAGGRLAAFVAWDAAAVIDMQSGRARFSVRKEQAKCIADDFFGACSPDGRYLCLSGKRDCKDPSCRLQVYDTESGELLGTFVADGGIGEMRFEPDGETVLFGMGNGRICRLRLMRS